MSTPTPPTPEALSRYAEAFNESSALRYFGARLSFPEGARVRVEVTVRPEQRGGLGSALAVNGGVLAAIFDLVIGVTPALVDPSKRSATMQLSMNFERPCLGEVVVAEAWIDRAGKNTLFASALIRDARGEICARAQGLCKLSRVPWADGGSPAVN